MTCPPPTGSGCSIWAVCLTAGDDLVGRLGDARELADRLDCQVGALVLDHEHQVDETLAASWIERGADEVQVLEFSHESQSATVVAADAFWRQRRPRLVLAAADRIGRAWAARLSARTGWPLVSPALLVQIQGSRLVATRLNRTGIRAQQIELPADQPAIVAMRPGVAQPLAADATRRGTIRRRATKLDQPSPTLAAEYFPPDPRRSDIRHLPKLIAGGRGVGSQEGFEILRRIAAKLDAGVAASRMAVDLGWIDAARQVGQTGKTVRPELYLACGISGASHHLEGMSESRHIVAINTDPLAPLMLQAELALQADLHQVLQELDRLLEAAT